MKTGWCGWNLRCLVLSFNALSNNCIERHARREWIGWEGRDWAVDIEVLGVPKHPHPTHIWVLVWTNWPRSLHLPSLYSLAVVVCQLTDLRPGFSARKTFVSLFHCHVIFSLPDLTYDNTNLIIFIYIQVRSVVQVLMKSISYLKHMLSLEVRGWSFINHITLNNSNFY